MTVRTRSGRFMIDIRHCHQNGHVERIRLAVPPNQQTRRGANRYEREVKAALRIGLDPRRARKEPPSPANTPPSPTAPRIADYAPIYLTEQATCGLKPSTLKSKRGIFGRWILPLFGLRPIDQIGTRDFTTLRMTLLAAGRKPKTINNVLVTLSAIVRWWHTEQDLPTPKIRVGLVKVHRDRKATFYEFEPFARLVRAAEHDDDPEVLALLLLGARAGLRMSEIRALHWSDCDLGPRPQLLVQRTREDDEELPPKGWRTRAVPMTPDLAAALQALPRHAHDPHVLLHEGRPLTRKQVRTRLNRVQRAAGLPETGFHITRHTFCSHLAMAGVPVTAIQALAGHVDLGTTQRYMHLAPSVLDDAIATLGRSVGTTPTRDPALARSAANSANPALPPTRGHSLGTSEDPATKTAP